MSRSDNRALEPNDPIRPSGRESEVLVRSLVCFLAYAIVLGGGAFAPADAGICSNDGFSATYGSGKAGSGSFPPLLLSSTRPVLGSSTDLFVYQGLPGAVPALMMGTKAVNLPFDGGALYVQPLLIVEFPTLDGNGMGKVKVNLPNDPGLCGAQIRMQAMYYDPGASGFYHTAQTNGLWWKLKG